MTAAGIPRFPTVTVTMAVDGSAHLNSAGTHVDYPAGDTAATRAAVTQYAAAIAAGLHRQVRMTVHDGGQVWLLAVAPEGTVTQLEAPTPKKGKPTATVDLVPAAAAAPRPHEVNPPRPISPAPRPANPWAPPASTGDERQGPATVPPTAAPAEEATVRVPRAARAATSPKLTITITVDGEGPFPILNTVLLGRNPAREAGEAVGSVVRLADPGKTTSKTHLLLERRGDRLWVTDRGSANGSRLSRAAGDHQQLAAGTAYELVDGDSIDLGGQTLTVRFATA